MKMVPALSSYTSRESGWVGWTTPKPDAETIGIGFPFQGVHGGQMVRFDSALKILCILTLLLTNVKLLELHNLRTKT